jgi:hypothetical protein
VSRQGLEAVVGRAILDAEFRFTLFADPDAVLAEYGLTPVEFAALKALDAETLDACGWALGQPILRVLRLQDTAWPS